LKKKKKAERGATKDLLKDCHLKVRLHFQILKIKRKQKSSRESTQYKGRFSNN
jgi:hypothetical protein